MDGLDDEQLAFLRFRRARRQAARDALSPLDLSISAAINWFRTQLPPAHRAQRAMPSDELERKLQESFEHITRFHGLTDEADVAIVRAIFESQKLYYASKRVVCTCGVGTCADCTSDALAFLLDSSADAF